MWESLHLFRHGHWSVSQGFVQRLLCDLQSWQPPEAICQTLPGFFLNSARLCEAWHGGFSATDSASASTQTQKTTSLGFWGHHRAPSPPTPPPLKLYLSGQSGTAWPLERNPWARFSPFGHERMFLSHNGSVPPFKMKPLPFFYCANGAVKLVFIITQMGIEDRERDLGGTLFQLRGVFIGLNGVGV